MTKKILSSLIVVAVVMVYFFSKKETVPTIASDPVIQETQNSTSSVVAKSPEAQPQRKPSSTGYVNSPSKEWENLLTTSLKAQAGNTLKELKIVKEKSLIWTRDDVPLHVQSVIVMMTNNQDVQSSFKALVDSQTGKVLETWDQSIFDPANVREGFRFKLDPRYSN